MATPNDRSTEKQASPVEQDAIPPTNKTELSNEKVHPELDLNEFKRMLQLMNSNSINLDRVPLPVRLSGKSSAEKPGESPTTKHDDGAAALATALTPNPRAFTEAKEAALELLATDSRATS